MGKTLFVVNGPTAAGKSHMLRFASRELRGFVAIPKLTTRPADRRDRAAAWSDLVHVTRAAFRAARPDYRYAWRGHLYGFARAALEPSLDGADAALVVVRHVPTIRRLTAELAPLDVVPVFVSASRETRRRRLIAEGFDEVEAERRLADEDDPPSESGGERELYAELLENESSPAEFHRAIRAMLARRAGS